MGLGHEIKEIMTGGEMGHHEPLATPDAHDIPGAFPTDDVPRTYNGLASSGSRQPTASTGSAMPSALSQSTSSEYTYDQGLASSGSRQPTASTSSAIPSALSQSTTSEPSPGKGLDSSSAARRAPQSSTEATTAPLSGSGMAVPQPPQHTDATARSAETPETFPNITLNEKPREPSAATTNPVDAGAGNGLGFGTYNGVVGRPPTTSRYEVRDAQPSGGSTNPAATGAGNGLGFGTYNGVIGRGSGRDETQDMDDGADFADRYATHHTPDAFDHPGAAGVSSFLDEKPRGGHFSGSAGDHKSTSTTGGLTGLGSRDAHESMSSHQSPSTAFGTHDRDSAAGGLASQTSQPSQKMSSPVRSSPHGLRHERRSIERESSIDSGSQYSTSEMPTKEGARGDIGPSTSDHSYQCDKCGTNNDISEYFGH